MAGLNANALITVAEYKVLAVIKVSETEGDANIEQFINYASKYIEDFTGRKFIAPAVAIDEYFDGDDTVLFNTKYWPLTTDIDAIYFLSDNDWATELTNINFSQNSDLGELQFTDGNRFAETGIPNYWKISYKYGYEQKNVPDDLKLACASIAAIRRTQYNNKTHGVSSRAISDQSTAYNANLNSWIIDILRDYKRRH